MIAKVKPLRRGEISRQARDDRLDWKVFRLRPGDFRGFFDAAYGLAQNDTLSWAFYFDRRRLVISWKTRTYYMDIAGN